MTKQVWVIERNRGNKGRWEATATAYNKKRAIEICGWFRDAEAPDQFRVVRFNRAEGK